MKIEIISWRDPKNPKAGGAEVCLMEISQRLIKSFGHQVSWFSSSFSNAIDNEDFSGISIRRRGPGPLIHLSAFLQFFSRRQQSSDLYIEDYHGISLCSSLYIRKPTVILVHEVAGPIWFKMFGWPISYIGFWIEKFVLRLLRKSNFVTVSESTKKDLIEHGIPERQIRVISEASDIPSVVRPLPRKDRIEQFVFIGRICKMKRVDLLLKAFALFRKENHHAKLILTGSMDPAFQREFDELIGNLKIGAGVSRTGFISQEDKARLLQNSLALVSCSMHEGFGLIVVEANSQGTPAITFEVNGYRDLIHPGINGFLCAYGDIEAMARRMSEICHMNQNAFEKLAESSLIESRKYSWDRSAQDMNSILTSLNH